MASQRPMTAIRGGKGGKSKPRSRLSRAPPPPAEARPGHKPVAKDRLIIGIDLGTTRDAVASALVLACDPASAKVEVHDFSPGSYGGAPEPFPPTQLYYREGRRLPSTGVQSKRLLEAASQRQDFDTELLFREWKLMFHSHQNDPAIQEVQAEIQRKLDAMGKKADDLLHDWVEVKYEEIFKGMRGYIGQSRFDELEIQIVVTVPPGRSNLAHETVRQAFIQGIIKSDAVSLASEPASLFCSWVHESTNKQNWKVGEIYIVADGGGGTCCFVRFRLMSLSPLIFIQEYESESLICGAENISNSFAKLAATKLPLHLPNRAWQLERMRRIFDEDTKFFFGTDSNLECAIDVDEEFYVFSHQELADCYDPCVTKLVGGIRRQLAKDDQTVDVIVLGGGLLANEYVRGIIGKTFSAVKILFPHPDKGYVAKGAVRERMMGNFVRCCNFTRCKAIGTFIELTKARETLTESFIKKLFKQPGDADGKKYIFLAELIAKKGDSGDALAGEKASKRLFKDARERHLSSMNPNLKINEEIFTFDYDASADEKWLAYCGDGKWMNMRGLSIDPPEQSEQLKWDLSDQINGKIDDLDLQELPKKVPFHILRYTLQMKFTELHTSFWIKVWASDKMKAKRPGESVAFLSNPKKHEKLATTYEISRSLDESFKLEDEDVGKRSHLTKDSSATAESARTTAASSLRALANMSAPENPYAERRATPVAKNPLTQHGANLGARGDSNALPGPSRSKRRKTQKISKGGYVDWDDVDEEFLDK